MKTYSYYQRNTVPVIAVYLLLILLCRGFLLDIETVQILSNVHPNSAESAMFGYSLSFLNDSLLVGAPKANFSDYGIAEPGGVYSCSFNDSLDNPHNQTDEGKDHNRCQLLNIDNEDNDIATADFNYYTIEDKSHQWLGATLSTEPKTGFVLTCAPRYVYKGRRTNQREPTGKCFHSALSGSSDYSFSVTSPCKEEYREFYYAEFFTTNRDDSFASYHKTGHGLCGFSVALGPNNELGIGAPGNYYFHGVLYSVAPQSDYRRYASTTDGPEIDDNNYMTWDLKYGEFDGDNSTIDYVVSAPRAAMLRGTILLWSKISNNEIRSLQNMTGQQAGAYFGYSLAVGNFNGVKGDGYDDIAVGAPLYADYENDMTEIGRIYVYYQNEVNRTLQLSTTITGKDTFGRFGLAMANVGDLNRDGYDDLMVSAPYGGPNHRGVVFLYHGSHQGLSEIPVQVIHSEDVSSSNPPVTFGWSITGNVDIDGNMYDDVAIGAYKSNQAMLFKTRPLITVKCNLQIAENRIQLPVPCSRQGAQANTEKRVLFDVQYCVEYEALGAPEEITVKGSMIFDSANNKTKRAFGLRTGNSIEDFYIPLKKSELQCSTVQGYIHPNIRDKTSPLNISMKFDLVDVTPSGDGNSPQPILNQLGPLIEPLQIEFIKSCDQCIPDLAVSVVTPTEFYVLGTEEKIDLRLTLANDGEDSYLTTLNITLPRGASYVNVVLDDDECLPISCQQTYINETANTYVSCDVGNPFPSQETTSFTIVLRIDDSQLMDETSLFFHFDVQSNYAVDKLPSNNSFDLPIPLMVKTSIFVTGASYPADSVFYNTSSSNSQQGPLVEHKYEIYTSGPSLIGTADVTIDWPLYNILKDDYILYVYEDIDIIQGEALCDYSPRYINPQNKTVWRDAAGESKRYKRDFNSADKGACNNDRATCVQLHCTLPSLSAESVILKMYSFLWMGSSTNSLTKNYTEAVAIKSSATANVLSVPYAAKPQTYSTATHDVTSYFEKYRPPKEFKSIDWKWVAIGVGCGLLLLIIIIVILKLCGFFKRYRPYAEAKVEKQKNGQPHEMERLHSE